MLGVSKSTLKRRFYELKLGSSWPNHNQETKRKMSRMLTSCGAELHLNRTKPRKMKKHSRKVEITNLVNRASLEEKHLSDSTLFVLSTLLPRQQLHRQQQTWHLFSPSASPESLHSTSAADSLQQAPPCCKTLFTFSAKGSATPSNPTFEQHKPVLVQPIQNPDLFPPTIQTWTHPPALHPPES